MQWTELHTLKTLVNTDKRIRHKSQNYMTQVTWKYSYQSYEINWRKI